MRALRHFPRLLLLTAATLVIVVAVALSLARLLLPMAGDYREWLVDQVADYLGTELTVGRLDARWQGLGPVLELGGVRLGGESGRALTVEHLGVALDLPASLLDLQPRFAGLELSGARVMLVRDADGDIGVRGLGGSDGAEGPPDWLLRVGDLQLTDVEILWLAADAPPLRIADLELELRNRGPSHRFRLGGRLPGVSDGRLELAGRLAGAPGDWQHWSGRLHARGRNVHLGDWLAQLPADWRAAAGIAEGTMDTELWLTLESGRPTAVAGSTRITRPRLTGTDRPAGERLSGQWWLDRGAAGDWRLDLVELGLEADGRDYRLDRLAAERGPEGWRARLQGLDLALLGRLADWPGLPDDWRNHLAGHAWQGQVEDLQLAGAPGGGPGALRAHGRLREASAEDLPGITGVRGVSGRFWLLPGRLALELAAPRLAIDFGGLFPAPLAGGMRGAVYAGWDGQRTWLRAPGLLLDSEDIQAETRLRLDLPADGRPYLDLFARFRDIPSGRVPAYLPVGIMDPRPVRWLDRALGTGGRVDRGAVLFHGPLDRFPFRRAEGRFAVRADFAGLDLDYKPGWPAARALAGEMAFVDAGMAIALDSGHIRGVEARHGHARIRSFRDPVLELDLGLAGPAADMLDYLREAPLGRDIENLGALEVRGPAELGLDIRLPLVGRLAGQRQVAGQLDLRGTDLLADRWRLHLEGVQGRLTFDELDFTGQGLRARLAGRPVDLEVETAGPAGRRLTRVRLAGELPPAAVLGDRLPGLDGFLAGASEWRAEVDLPHGPREDGDGGLAVRLHSDLVGTRVDLPCPFAKPAASAQPIDVAFAPEAGGGTLRLQYGERVDAALRLAGPDAQGVVGGEIRLHDGAARLPARDTLRIAGRMQSFSLSEWRAVLAALEEGDARLAGAGRGVDAVALHFGEFAAFGRSVEEVELELVRLPAAWQAEIDAEAVAGRMLLPFEPGPGRPVRVELERLRVDAMSPRPGGTGIGLEPGDVPPLQVDVAELTLADFRFRNLALVTAPDADGLAIHHLALGTEHLAFRAEGDWHRGVDGGSRTRLTVRAEGDDLGAGLSELGFRHTLSGGTIEKAHAEVRWPGAPWAFDWRTASGQGGFEVTDGAIENIDPGAGRAIGLFSLAALPRRLGLDFQDVFGKGYRFDRMEGRNTLRDGSLFSSPLVMSGPSGRIEITGRTGIAARDFDQRVRVMPETSALPVIGALAGGTGVGAAVLLLQQVLKKDIQEATRIEYRLTGSWENPEIEPVSE